MKHLDAIVAVNDFLSKYDLDDLLIINDDTETSHLAVVSQGELKRLLIMAYNAGYEKADELVWN